MTGGACQRICGRGWSRYCQRGRNTRWAATTHGCRTGRRWTRSSSCCAPGVSGVLCGRPASACLPRRIGAFKSGSGLAGACPVGLYFVERHLWQSPDEAGIAGRRPGGRSPPDGSPDARQRCAGPAQAAVQADHGQPSRPAGCAEPARSGLHRNRARQEVGYRHLLRVDPATTTPWWRGSSRP
jgi:hypothetical protein